MKAGNLSRQMQYETEGYRTLEVTFLKLHEQYVEMVSLNASPEALQRIRLQIKAMATQMSNYLMK